MGERQKGSDAFEQAAIDLTKLPVLPNNEELLDTYKYFKQVTVGPCNTSRPGMLDLKGKAKWDSWNGIKEMSKEEADRLYIAYVNNLKTKYAK